MKMINASQNPWFARAGRMTFIATASLVGLGGCAIESDSEIRTLESEVQMGQAYTLENVFNGLCVDVAANSKDNGGNILLWSCHDNANQQFVFDSVGGGYVQIRSVSSGKCLDVWARSREPGANIAQYTCNGGTNQQFRIDDVASGGVVRIVSRHSGMALDAWAWGQENGTNIAQWHVTSGDNQKFVARLVGSGSDGGNDDSSAERLPLEGNPVIDWFDDARGEWSSSRADIVLSYQQDNGGWPKNLDYDSAGSGSGGSDRGTFDNGATVTEIVYLAERYRTTGQSRYRDAVRRAADFMLDAQYDTGAWPQYYPLRGGYSDHATFNDNAMAHVLTVLDRAAERAAPFDTDVFNSSDRADFRAARDSGIDYILRSQWRQNGQLTVWCAQHGAHDYQPKAGRAYELASLSGSESVGVLAFLMTQPQTDAIETAVRAGVNWFRNSVLEGYVYENSNVVPRSGGHMWYRFYKLDTNRGFFSDRDGGTYYDIMDISDERRTGYSWGGTWGDKIISYANDVGY